MDEQQQPRFERPTDAVALWGHIATVRFRVTIPDDPEWEGRLPGLWEQGLAIEFYDAANRLARVYLGPDVEVGFSAESGSFSVWVWITLAGMAYKAIKDYPAFVEGLNLLISHLQQLIDRLFGQEGMESVKTTVGDLQPGAALYAAETSITLGSTLNQLDSNLNQLGSNLNQLRNILIYVAAITTILLILVGISVF